MKNLDNIDYIEELQKEFCNTGSEGLVLRDFIDFLRKKKKVLDLKSKFTKQSSIYCNCKSPKFNNDYLDPRCDNCNKIME